MIFHKVDNLLWKSNYFQFTSNAKFLANKMKEKCANAEISVIQDEFFSFCQLKFKDNADEAEFILKQIV